MPRSYGRQPPTDISTPPFPPFHFSDRHQVSDGFRASRHFRSRGKSVHENAPYPTLVTRSGREEDVSYIVPVQDGLYTAVWHNMNGKLLYMFSYQGKKNDKVFGTNFSCDHK